MALANQSLSCIPFSCTSHSSYVSSKLSFLFSGNDKRLRISFLTSPPNCTPSSSSLPSLSSPSIFLPFLQEEEKEEEEQQQKYEQEGEEEHLFEQSLHSSLNDEGLDDPIYKFFKTRTSTQDPPRESKLTLQRNRRTGWHLANDFNIMDEADPETQSVSKEEVSESEEKTELGSDGVPKIEGAAREILGIARNLPDNSTLGECLGAYERRLGKKECLEVLGLMCQEGLLMSCLYFYEWMGLQEPSLVCPRACSLLFPALGRARMGDKLIILWRNLPNTREFRDVHIYNAAMSGLLSSGRYDDAWEVYETMEINNILPDRVTGSVMITIMRKQGNSAKDAWEFFERMNRKGVKWSLEAVGALIKSFCDEGLFKQALIIQGEMEKKGISTNTIIYNTLMDAYCKSNCLEEAEALFVEIKAKGLKPTSATFNILMDAYSKRMQPEIVEKLLREMKNIGLQPNANSYTNLISAYGKQKNMSDMAADAFLRMKKSGIKPTSHSYTALIHAYSISGWHEKAYKAYENMQREGVKPSIETYTALLDAFRRNGDTETLMTIWKTMIREKVEGNHVTFNILLDGFAKQGCYVEARDVICEFGKLGFQPTAMTYNMLINAYARGGQHLKIPQLLKEMAVLELKPDSITYCTMIYAFVRVRDFKRAFFYHKQMVKSGQVPDTKSYEKLRSILKVNAAIKNKKDKNAILGIVNSKMGSLKVKKKGKKDEFWKNKKKHVRSYGSAAQAG